MPANVISRFKTQQPVLCWLALVLCLFTGACASQLRPSTAPLHLEIGSTDFVDGSAQQILFAANGFVRNPNDLAIKPVGFTYQTFIEDELIDSGDIQAPDAFQFKSRTPFSINIRVPTNRLGGYVSASSRDHIGYKIDLQLTDERFKRATLVKEGFINLSHMLELPYIESRVTEYLGQLVIEAQVINPNHFILVVDSCSITFTDYGLSTELFSTTAMAPEDSKAFSIPLSFNSSKGAHLAALYSCTVGGTAVETPAKLVVH